uniref:DSBA domain-containing protein n=1 Tax=Steinernema glaseri TaxID=37863 RepID=A0A1I7Z527_9BILA
MLKKQNLKIMLMDQDRKVLDYAASVRVRRDAERRRRNTKKSTTLTQGDCCDLFGQSIFSPYIITTSAQTVVRRSGFASATMSLPVGTVFQTLHFEGSFPAPKGNGNVVELYYDCASPYSWIAFEVDKKGTGPEYRVLGSQLP